MIISKDFDNEILKTHKWGLAIGNFDGVHVGHQELLSSFVNECRKKQLKAVVLTFNPHPYLFINGNVPYLITNNDAKNDLIKLLGIDLIVEMNFDASIRDLSAEEFLKKFLGKQDKLQLIYLGHDFKLGKGKCDARELIRKIFSNSAIEIYEHPARKIDNEVVSSTSVRENIETGNITTANNLLNRNFRLEGRVVAGKGVGGKHLFKTANLMPNKSSVLPGTGVYITKVFINNRKYDSITNVGFNPSIAAENPLSIETHLFHFDDDIYKENISVEFLTKIRDEKKYETLEELKVQIEKDIEQAKLYFRDHSNVKLALIGKDIQHSQSQRVYEKLLKKFISYDLIDIHDEKSLPSLSDLKAKYVGVSITAPYKQSYLDVVEVKNKELDSINTLVWQEHKVVGYNTDYLAINEILQKYISDEDISKVILLGDGSMSKICSNLLRESGVSFVVLSRRQSNLDHVDKGIIEKPYNTLVINTCLRDYTFSLPRYLHIHFWDLNYNLDKHSQLFLGTSVKYRDGLGMLELQAKYALCYWNLKTF